MDKLEKAKEYLENALKLIKKFDIKEKEGITHLNLIPVLSKLNLHESAFEHASFALIKCQ